MFKFRYSILPILFLVLQMTAYGKNIDSVIDAAFPTQPKPFVILNIPSSDCITCRAEATSFLNGLRSYVDSSRLKILTDSKSMLRFFDKYENVFNGYAVLVEEEISKKLADNYKSALYIVTSEGIVSHPLTTLNDSLIEEIKGYFKPQAIKDEMGQDWSAVSPYKKYKAEGDKKHWQFFDSTFTSPDNEYALLEKSCIILDEAFQTGAFLEFDKHSVGIGEPAISEMAYNGLIEMIQELSGDSFLLPADKAAIKLQEMTLPVVYIRDIVDGRGNDYYASFYINTVQEIVEGNHKKVGIKGRNFIGKLSQSGFPLSFDSFGVVGMADTMHFEGKYYLPLLFFGFQVSKESVLLPIREVVSINGDFEESSRLLIGEFEIVNKKRNRLKHIYDFHREKSNGFLVRANDKGEPVIIDYVNRCIVPFNSKVIPYSSLSVDGGRDSIVRLHDCFFKDNLITYTASTSSHKYIYGTFGLKEGSVSYKEISAPVSANSKFKDGDIYLFNKKDTMFFVEKCLDTL